MNRSAVAKLSIEAALQLFGTLAPFKFERSSVYADGCDTTNFYGDKIKRPRFVKNGVDNERWFEVVSREPVPVPNHANRSRCSPNRPTSITWRK